MRDVKNYLESICENHVNFWDLGMGYVELEKVYNVYMNVQILFGGYDLYDNHYRVVSVVGIDVIFGSFVGTFEGVDINLVVML